MFIPQEVIERVKKEAEYIIKNKATIRMAARRFCLSKTTVHLDVTVRLFYIDKGAYKNVRKVLDYNISQRALRGGMATKAKFANRK